MKISTTIISLLCLLLGMSTGLVQATEQTQTIQTGTVEEVLVPRVFRLDGVVEAVHQSTISAQTNGQIEAIYYDIDDVVEKGALLVKLKDTKQQADVQKAEADLRAANAIFEDARKNYKRIKALYTKKLIAKSERDNAQATWNTSKAKLDASKAALVQVQEQLSYTKITAPYNGIVIKRHMQIGEVAQSGVPLMSGISLDQLRVAVDVPQSLIMAVRSKGRAKVEMLGGNWIEVTDLTIFPFADPTSNTFKVRLSLPDNLQGLSPGLLVKTMFETGVVPALVVPSAAVVYRSEVTAVYVLNDEQKIRFRYVRLGEHLNAENIAVLAGLQAGDQVLLDPIKAAVQLKQQRLQKAHE